MNHLFFNPCKWLRAEVTSEILHIDSLPYLWYLVEWHSLRDPECVLQLSNTLVPCFYPQKTVIPFAWDVQFGFLSIYIIKIKIIPNHTSQHLCYYYPHTLKCAHFSIDWPNLAAVLHGYPGLCRLHNSLSQEVFYCFFSLVLLSVNTSTLTGVAIFISLIEE